MGKPITDEQKYRVISLWYLSYLRDEIAKITGIGKGSVSNILKEFKEIDHNSRKPGRRISSSWSLVCVCIEIHPCYISKKTVNVYLKTCFSYNSRNTQRKLRNISRSDL